MKKKLDKPSPIKSAKLSMESEKSLKKPKEVFLKGSTKSHTDLFKKSFDLCRLLDEEEESTVQGTLPYQEIFENGICHVENDFYTKTVEFFDINYRLAPEETQRHIFDGYCHFINYFDEKISVQLSFINAKSDKREIDDVISIPIIDDELVDLRKEYSDMLRNQHSKGNSGIARKKYITFGIHAAKLRDATLLLLNIETAVIANFKSMGVKTKTLNGIELLKVLYKIMHVGSKKEFYYEPKYVDSTVNGLRMFDGSDKDAIAPRCLDFSEREYFMIGKRLAKISDIILCSPDFDDATLIDALSVDESMVITINIHPVNMTKAMKIIRNKLTSENSKKVDENKKALNAGYDMAILPPGLQKNIDGCQDYYDSLTKDGEKLFYVSMGMITYGKDERKLKIATDKVSKIFETQNHQVHPLVNKQIEGFKSILPLCHDNLGRPRTLLTTHIALMIPFTSQELFMKGESIYYGLNTLSNNMIMCDRKQLNTPNGLILGKPGSGKSFSTKREIFNSILISDDDVIITDPEGEYHSLVRGLNGQVINISNKSNDHINPMDINLDVVFHPEKYEDSEESEDAGTLIKDKFEFLCSFCEMICCTSGERGKTELSGEDVSAIDAATKNVYDTFLNNNPSYETMPTLEDFYNELSRLAYMDVKDARFEGIPENVQYAAAGIVGKMRTYIKGSNDVFNHRTNINLNNRVICFNIKNLGSNLRKIGMFIIQNMVWNRVSANRMAKKYTRYYVDEFHLLLGQPQTAQYSVEIWKRFRKWGGIPTGITQNVKDLLISQQVENIFSNSDFILMLNQSSDDRKILAQRLQISEDQQECIRDVGQGQGLIFFGGVIVPFIDKYPENTRSYKLMTTKLTETI